MSFADKRNPRPFACRDAKSGFTLIELLAVIGVVVILVAITVGVMNGVEDTKNRAAAKGEVAALGQGLEQFKLKNSDYPWTNASGDSSNAVTLSKALLGWKQFTRTSGSVSYDDKSTGEVPTTGPTRFIDPEQFVYDGNMPTTANTLPADIEFTDPWGEPYVYLYKDAGSSNTWDNFGFILYSKGADGLDVPVGADGILTDAIRNSEENLDNIYFGE